MGAIWVIKVGGERVADPIARRGLVAEVMAIREQGVQVLVVHGGGPQITDLAERLGLQPNFVDGLRVTDAATMELAEMVLTGRVGRELLGQFVASGQKAVVLSGRDGGILSCQTHRSVQKGDKSISLGRVGEIQSVDVTLLKLLMDQGMVPLLSPIGAAPGGEALNVNADQAAAAVAAALGAERLYFLTEVPGVRTADGYVSALELDQANLLIESGTVNGGMIPKLKAGFWARSHGVAHVSIGSGVGGIRGGREAGTCLGVAG